MFFIEVLLEVDIMGEVTVAPRAKGDWIVCECKGFGGAGVSCDLLLVVLVVVLMVLYLLLLLGFEVLLVTLVVLVLLLSFFTPSVREDCFFIEMVIDFGTSRRVGGIELLLLLLLAVVKLASIL